jgi:hypothetical protein
MFHGFKKLFVYGVYLPSNLAIAAICEGVDDKNLKLIRQASNEWVDNQKNMINLPELAPTAVFKELSELFERYRTILESLETKIDFSSAYFIKSKFVMSWHVTMRGLNPPWDVQKYSRIAKKKTRGKRTDSLSS